jgi:hypothetical protein
MIKEAPFSAAKAVGKLKAAEIGQTAHRRPFDAQGDSR